MATIEGTAFDNFLVGSGDADVIVALAGEDFVLGQGGDDALFGGDGDDILIGGEGEDVILGGDGADLILGSDGDDILKGDDGNDEIVGGVGDDFIEGGAGRDELVGGDGLDTFQFTGGGDQDVVVDFRKGEDILLISRMINGTDVETPDDLAVRTMESGDNVIVDLGAGDTITLLNVTKDDVDDDPASFFLVS